ncbi:hypothetical protein NQZ68_005304 [Dissostichus eleginoides]|nr:hypothetical protein NQZ68_005304 [Dissostichus eleginoides]
MSAASTETSAPLPTAGSRVFFQGAPAVGCVGTGPITGDDPVQRRQGKVTVKYDRKELRKRLVLEEWIIEQLSELYDCEYAAGVKLGGRVRTGGEGKKGSGPKMDTFVVLSVLDREREIGLLLIWRRWSSLKKVSSVRDGSPRLSWDMLPLFIWLFKGQRGERGENREEGVT